MISRRDLIIGSACVAAAGGAYALKPRRNLSLLGDRSLAEIVPTSFGSWGSEDVSSLVAPKIEGSLASRLYNETVGRIYRDTISGAEVMMLLAYGAKNSDELQLHRPESCYPAFGFSLASNKPVQLWLAETVTVPARHIVAEAPGRRESIVYWSRLGEFLPVDGSEQRRDRLRAAIGGYIPDGVLARFSALGEDPAQVMPGVERFAASLVRAVAAASRDALIGTARAQALAAALRR